MTMYDTSYYKQINLEEAEQATRLAKILMWVYAPKSVLDIGSATGLYLKPFADAGLVISGVDYSASAIAKEVLQVPRKSIRIVDITKQSIATSADLALCIEVLEHIPATGTKAAITHIAETSNTIFFSAAQPGQGGVGHINTQPKEYWEAFFTGEGFRRDLIDEEYIKTLISAGYHMGWLVNNMMIFKRLAGSNK